MYNKVKEFNIHVIGVLERRKKEWDTSNRWINNSWKFLNTKDRNPPIQEAPWVPSNK